MFDAISVSRFLRGPNKSYAFPSGGRRFPLTFRESTAPDRSRLIDSQLRCAEPVAVTNGLVPGVRRQRRRSRSHHRIRGLSCPAPNADRADQRWRSSRPSRHVEWPLTRCLDAIPRDKLVLPSRCISNIIQILITSFFANLIAQYKSLSRFQGNTLR